MIITKTSPNQNETQNPNQSPQAQGWNLPHPEVESRSSPELGSGAGGAFAEKTLNPRVSVFSPFFFQNHAKTLFMHKSFWKIFVMQNFTKFNFMAQIVTTIT